LILLRNILGGMCQTKARSCIMTGYVPHVHLRQDDV
jgi:hypothetical protein